MGSTLTIAFNFLDLEELDADYERSVDQAERVAALFQTSADTDSLGSSFLSTAPDPFALYIQRVRFEPGNADLESTARAAVARLALQCRTGLLSRESSQSRANTPLPIPAPMK
jgi:hypothetical protein